MIGLGLGLGSRGGGSSLSAETQAYLAAMMLGYLDWNGDPQVQVKTGFHTGTIV